jgi:glycosyltransferase involved in cell wall biosynthesis
MRIGIDATCWENRRGFGRFTRELLQAMWRLHPEHRFVLFSDAPLPSAASAANVEVVVTNPSQLVTSAAVASSHRRVADMLAFTRAAARIPMDVMFFPAVYSWFPVLPRQPVVVTLHDAIAEHFPELVMPHWRGRVFWALKMRLARWQSNRFITVSGAARDEIVAHLGIPAERIDVISEAPDRKFRPVTDAASRQAARERAGLPLSVPYLIYVGGFAPHKNLKGLLAALAAASDDSTGPLHLALVGDPGGAGFHSNTSELEAFAREHPALDGRVHFTGFVADEDLVALYSDALAGVMPSFSEGFGLPAIEAMACGTPVLASDAGSLPEVVGETGLLFDPWSVASMAQQIRRIAGDPALRATLARRALDRAAEFTWDNAARLAMASLEKAAARV